MIEIHLTRAIRRFLTKVCEEYLLETAKNGNRKPKIVNGYLPPKRAGADDDVPFILVRAESASADESAISVDVSIVIGIFSKQDDGDVVGHDIVLEIISRIRTALMRLPNQILENRYMLDMPIEWDNVADQPYPNWQMAMTTHWVMPNPRPWSDGHEW